MKRQTDERKKLVSGFWCTSVDINWHGCSDSFIHSGKKKLYIWETKIGMVGCEKNPKKNE